MKERGSSGKSGGAGREDLWISGVNPVREALRSESMRIREMVLARSDATGEELAGLARQRGLSIQHEAKAFLSSKTGHQHHQGVALRMEDYPYISLDALIQEHAQDPRPLMVLDCIQDPQNLGALIRSGCFLGAGGMVLPKDRSAGVTATVIKVAAGGASHLPMVQVVNLARALDRMKEAGLWIVGLAMEGQATIYETDLTVPLALVVGNEHKGIRPLILKKCDLLVRIPAMGPLESLNAAAAGAVALAEVQRQRLMLRRT